jgi:undecaprenyl diphosphate synthase
MQTTSQKTSQYPLPARIPRHIAIIMDGNGRWAKQRGRPRLFGHRAGTENLRRVLEAAVEFGVERLTVYAFSTENWNRPEDEVSGLMHLVEDMIDRELNNLHKNGVQLRHIGREDRLSEHLREKVHRAVEKTRNNTRLILNIAFNYGGRDEIVQAIKHIIDDGISAEQITEALVSSYLYTAGQPDPDLVVRTSGEVRVSNFLIWQSAYAEWYFTPKYWPDFDKDELYKAIVHFGERERRFGLVSEQIQTP